MLFLLVFLAFKNYCNGYCIHGKFATYPDKWSADSWQEANKSRQVDARIARMHDRPHCDNHC